MKDPKITVNQDVLQLIGEVDEFKGRWQFFEETFSEQLKPLNQSAAIESIGASARIEGSTIATSQVEALVSNAHSQISCSADQHSVAAYAEVLNLISKSYKKLDLTEKNICYLHEQLFIRSSKDEDHRGKYKTRPNHVIVNDAEGHEKSVVSVTSSPFATPREMRELVEWCNKNIDESSMHPLLVISVFLATFLSIHPFQDGNCRLSRILVSLMLLRAGYSFVSYESLEKVIEDNQKQYYEVLSRIQTTLKLVSPDWTPWLTFFLGCLKTQKNNLSKKIDKKPRVNNNDSLPTLSLKILNFLKENERLTIMELSKKADANKNTVKVRLRELVGDGRIKRHGRARATWYSL